MWQFCFKLTALVLLFALNVDAYKNNFGKCAQVESQPNLKMDKMLGNWYVIEATSTNKKCLTYYFNDKFGFPGWYLLTETFAPSNIAEFFGRRNDYHRIGVLNPLDAFDPSVMSYKMSQESVKYKFTVLSTDYETYALIYACKKIALGLRRWSAMILSRTPQLEPLVMTKLWTNLALHHIDIYSMSKISHENCRNSVYKTVGKKTTTTTPVPAIRNEFFGERVPATTPEVVIARPSNETIENNLNAIFQKPQTDSNGLKEWVMETTVPQLRGFLDPEEKSANLRAEENPRFFAF